MPIYTYETVPSAPDEPVRRFEVRQAMSEPALTHDPQTGAPVRRVLSGGLTVLSRSAGAGPRRAAEPAGGCGLGEGCGCRRA
jgi:predicted nucleic acid-binding Zn ribbon protein